MSDLPADLMRPRDIAVLLGVHLSTVHRWLDAGTLPFYRLGGRRRISRADAVALLQRGTSREKRS